MAVVADPQVNRLLTPADDAVELALQIEHQPIDKMEIVARHGRVLNAQQVRLQLIPAASSVSCSSRRVPEVSDSSSSQLEIAARQSLFNNCAISSFTSCCCSSIMRCVRSMLSKISATEYFSGAKRCDASGIHHRPLPRRPPRASARRRRSTAASRDAASRIRADGYNNR